MKPGIVFIGEDVDDEDIYVLTGRFTAHWESDDGRQHLDGPQGVSAAEAIAWGREHADVVLIRLADSDVHHSAGVRQPAPTPEDNEDCPVWPEGTQVERRRRSGMEHLDVVTEEPSPWEVRLPRRISREDPEGDLTRLKD